MNFAGRFASLFNTKGKSGEIHARNYLQGLLSKEPSKNMERMSEVLEGVNWQNLQQFISDTKWSSRAVWDAVAEGANARLGGHRDSTLLIDESAHAKQGNASAGVARQHNGRLGKTDNCQVGVFSVLARGAVATMVGARLFLPDEWYEDPARCRKAGIPEEEIQARTKIDLARELIAQARAQKLDFQAVAFDRFYGRDQSLVSELAASGLRVLADIPTDTLVWASKPSSAQRPKHLGASGAVRADAIAMPKLKKITLRDGENGPVNVQCAAQRVWLWPKADAAPSEWWLVFMVQSDGSRKHTLIHAPATTKLEVLARWQGQRFFVEQTFKTAKSHVGAADYQVRKWHGWHHHMALVGLALLFLLEEKQAHAVELPLLSAADITELLDYYFCSPTGVDVVLERIHARHVRRTKVTESKRRVARKNRALVAKRS